MRPDRPNDPTDGNGDWRAEWRRFLGDDELRGLDTELDEAEVRILEELSTEPPGPEESGTMERGQHPSMDDTDDPLAAVAIAIINQGLTIPLGHGSVRLLEDRVLFGVALPIEDARALVAAWTELAHGDGDGSPASPSEVTIASLLASLLDPLAMRMLGGGGDDDDDDDDSYFDD